MARTVRFDVKSTDDRFVPLSKRINSRKDRRVTKGMLVNGVKYSFGSN